MLMTWFRYADTRVTNETILASYHALEMERMLHTIADDWFFIIIIWFCWMFYLAGFGI